MPYDLRGYMIFDVVRGNVGSPASTVQFTKFNNSPGSLCDAVMLNNLGSGNVFVALSGTALVGGGSTLMMMPPGTSRSLDIKVNSLSICASGGNVVSEFEVVGLGI